MAPLAENMSSVDTSVNGMNFLIVFFSLAELQPEPCSIVAGRLRIWNPRQRPRPVLRMICVTSRPVSRPASADA
jgi:hypothetical protein